MFLELPAPEIWYPCALWTSGKGDIQRREEKYQRTAFVWETLTLQPRSKDADFSMNSSEALMYKTRLHCKDGTMVRTSCPNLMEMFRSGV